MDAPGVEPGCLIPPAIAGFVQVYPVAPSPQRPAVQADTAFVPFLELAATAARAFPPYALIDLEQGAHQQDHYGEYNRDPDKQARAHR